MEESFIIQPVTHKQNLKIALLSKSMKVNLLNAYLMDTAESLTLQEKEL